MPSLEERLAQKVDQRKNNNAFRQLHGKSKGIDFCSNDYLGLAKAPEIHEKITKLYVSGDPLGSTGSRLISGDSSEYQSLERYLSDFHNGQSALIFNSGYDANVGFFSTIPQRGDIIFYDELCHASIRDGIRLSLAKSHSFIHNNMDALRTKLESSKGTAFVSVESIYSMNGDIAPLKALVSLCDEFQANIIVDEAHSTGIYGDKGEGLTVSLNLQDKIFARLHTFGKGMGAHGAAWISSTILKDYLINYCNSFIYTTALPAHSLAHIQSAYNFLSENPSRIHKLHHKIKLFKKLVAENKIRGFISSNSPIQSCIISGNKSVKAVTSRLQKNGFNVRPILHPTVPEGKERIRICLHTYNTDYEIIDFMKTLKVGLSNLS